MNTQSNDFVTVHMPGLKGALLARAQAERISVSVLVRRAVACELGIVEASTTPEVPSDCSVPTPVAKLSIRFPVGEAEQLKEGARQAGLSRGAFIMALLARIPSSSAPLGSRLDCLAALTASCAELSALRRNIYQLTALLRHGNVEAAQEYRRMLDTLSDDIRAHLRLAASALAEVRPHRSSGDGRQLRQAPTHRMRRR